MGRSALSGISWARVGWSGAGCVGIFVPECLVGMGRQSSNLHSLLHTILITISVFIYTDITRHTLIFLVFFHLFFLSFLYRLT